MATSFPKLTAKLAEERRRRNEEEQALLKKEELDRRRALKKLALEKRQQRREDFDRALAETQALQRAEAERVGAEEARRRQRAERKALAVKDNYERCTQVQRKSQTLLQVAAEGGRETRVAQLIASRHSVNAQEAGSGWTPLHWAVHNDDGATLALLLQSRANPNIREYHHGDVPINFACSLHRVDMVEQLLAAKSWVHHTNRHGQTLLAAAGQAGHRDIVAWLLQLGAHKTPPPPTGVHKEYLGVKDSDGTLRTEKTLLSQLYPAVQEYEGSYNRIPETAAERYAREQTRRNHERFGAHTQPHPEKWAGASGPRKAPMHRQAV